MSACYLDQLGSFRHAFEVGALFEGQTHGTHAATRDAVVSRLVQHPKDKVSVGAVAKLAPLAYAVAPALGRWTMNRMLGFAISRAPAQKPNPGGLFAPGDTGGLSGHLPLGRIVGITALGLLATVSAAMMLTRKG